MLEIIKDTLFDLLNLLPFLFISFLIMEYLEHKMKNKNRKIITSSKKLGPLFGGLLGAFPQCGFSVIATNLFSTKVITLGTLISVYLSTSDEMLPILISEKADFKTIFTFIFIKLVIGITFGFIIDLLFSKKISSEEIHDFCDEEHCDCEHGIIKSTIKHTLNILLFIFIITFILNICFNYLDEVLISKLFMKQSILGVFITSLIGLIPNCGSSVVITELYLNNTISFAATISGLLVNSGVGLLILFKMNKNKKENIMIVCSMYLISVVVGILFYMLGV